MRTVLLTHNLTTIVFNRLYINPHNYEGFLSSSSYFSNETKATSIKHKHFRWTSERAEAHIQQLVLVGGMCNRESARYSCHLSIRGERGTKKNTLQQRTLLNHHRDVVFIIRLIHNLIVLHLFCQGILVFSNKACTLSLSYCRASYSRTQYHTSDDVWIAAVLYNTRVAVLNFIQAIYLGEWCVYAENTCRRKMHRIRHICTMLMMWMTDACADELTTSLGRWTSPRFRGFNKPNKCTSLLRAYANAQRTHTSSLEESHHQLHINSCTPSLAASARVTYLNGAQRGSPSCQQYQQRAVFFALEMRRTHSETYSTTPHKGDGCICKNMGIIVIPARVCHSQILFPPFSPIINVIIINNNTSARF